MNENPAATPSLRLCFFGTYPKAYTVSRILEQAARDAGCEVLSCQNSPWESHPVKLPEFFRLARLPVLAAGYLRAARSFARALRRCPASILVAGFQGNFDVLVAKSLGLVKQRPVVFAPLVTLWETVVLDRAVFPSRSFRARMLHRLDRWSLSAADRIVIDTVAHAEFLCREFDLPRTKVRVFHLGCDTNVFRAMPSFRRTGRTKVLFYGSFLPLHGVEVILEAARLLREEREIQFTLRGGGWGYSQVASEVSASALPNVVLGGWVDYEALPQLISEHDVCLGIFSSGIKASMVIPNKLYQCAAVGRAVVSADTPAVQEVFRNGQSILLVPPDNPAELANAIRRLHREPELRQDLAAGALQLMEEHFSPAARAKRFRDAFLEGLV